MSDEMTPTEPLHETETLVEPTPVVVAPSPEPLLQTPAQPRTESKSAWRALVAPAWFLLGILVGLGIFAAYTRYTDPPQQPLSMVQVQQAAREGLLQAIQEMQAQSSGNNNQGPQTVDRNAFAVREANFLGNKDAPVTIVEFADFQCPFCGRHHLQVEPALVQEFVNTGKVNLLYKHLAFLGPESIYAAVASECAADQGKFWAFHDYLFEHQQGENEGAFEKPKLLGFGKELGLDATRFDKCVNSDETVARVQADTQEAQKFGVGSTPTFFVNGKPLVGLKSPDEFKQAIEAALNQ